MIRHAAMQGLVTIACAVALGGCSAAENSHQAARRGDDRMRLTPDPAFAGARIAVVFADRGMQSEQFRFEWSRNGSLIHEARTSVLEPAFFAKGDRIEVTAIGPGAEPTTERRLQATVRVANTPPTVARVTVVPSGTTGRAELQATPESVDRDGDRLTHSYRWFRNGALIPSATGASLAMEALGLGEQIAVEVVASDGESESPPVRGEANPIANHSPRFTSPPTALGPSEGVLRYQAVATDEDRDRLRYELVNGPAGTVVNPDGNISWTVPSGAQRGGEHSITIRALDSKGGEATQQFTIRLGSPVANR